MLTLAQHRKTDYRIVIAEHPSPSVFHAAEELKRFLGIYGIEAGEVEKFY